MMEKMKILIAYDGSECANAALDSLRHAGLPNEADTIVMTVADVFVPPPINEEIDNTFPLYVPDGIRRAHAHAERELEKARSLTEQAGKRLRSAFPNWKVQSEAVADSPAWAVISKADEWKPDLIIVGSHGHSVLGGRLILGSVSQKVLYEARCSVRIARQARESDSPLHILICTDGSNNAVAAVEAVARRVWPAGSEARILSVLDTVMFVTPDSDQPSVVKWVEVGDDESCDWVCEMFEPLAEKLRKAGLIASVEVKEGNPKEVIVEAADDWRADSVFVGAKGLRGVDRILLGSVSAAVAARAHCSVEVVRSAVNSEI